MCITAIATALVTLVLYKMLMVSYPVCALLLGLLYISAFCSSVNFAYDSLSLTSRYAAIHSACASHPRLWQD